VSGSPDDFGWFPRKYFRGGDVTGQC